MASHIITWTVVFSVLGLVALSIHGAEPAAQNGDIVVLRKNIQNDSELVVIREASQDINGLNNIISDLPLDDIKALSRIRIEIQRPNKPSFLLTTRILPEYEASSMNGFEVLDVLVTPGQIVLAIAQNRFLVLWRIRVLKPEPLQCAWINQRDWTKAAALLPLDHTLVSAKLSLTNEKSVKVEVADLRPNLLQTTRFIQNKEEWKFDPLKE